MRLESYPIDTYINCAANVKHFSAGTDIEDINIGGVKNAIDFCKKIKCRLIQVSTYSVAGNRIGDTPKKGSKLDETSLYFGQDLSNKYVNSKFMAERIVLEAATEGLDAKIMRAGNLMARADGEFQINFNTNSFLGILKAYNIIGSVPYDLLNEAVELSPIDYSAHALLTLSAAPEECTVFHIYSNHTVFYRDIFNSLDENDILIRRLELSDWINEYNDALKDQEKAKYLLSLFAYKSREGHQEAAPISADNAYTIQALDRFGLHWPITSDGYMLRFMDAIKGLGFFDYGS